MTTAHQSHRPTRSARRAPVRHDEDHVPRIRSLKPEFWTDPDIGDLTDRAKLLFLATWNHADDNGVLMWNPRLARTMAFTYTDIPDDELASIMQELLDGNFLHNYTPESGGSYAQVVNFARHQRVKPISGPNARPLPNGINPASRAPAPTRFMEQGAGSREQEQGFSL